MLGLFDVVKRDIEDAQDCALVQSQLSTINQLRIEAYGKIDKKKQMVMEKPLVNHYRNDSADPEKPEVGQQEEPISPPVPQRNTKVINDISFFKPEKMLETEADVEEYITQLREKLLELLKEKNIRV